MAASVFRPYKVSPLYQAHRALGARCEEVGEWRLPESFGDPQIEAERVRQGVGLLDTSAIGKLDLKGHEVQQVVTTLPAEECLSILRLATDHVLVLTQPERHNRVTEVLLQALSQTPCCGHLTDVTSALAAFALVGPRAAEVLAKLTALDLRARTFPDGVCAQGGLANVHVIIHRKDWGRLPAYHILLRRELAEYGWEVIRKAGASAGLAPFGLSAERLLRGEK